MTRQDVKKMLEDEIREWWNSTDREEAIEEAENTINKGRGWDDWEDYESWDALLGLLEDELGDPDEAVDEAANIYEKWQDEILTKYLNKYNKKKENKTMTDPNKYTGEFTFEGRTYETNAKGNYFYVTDIEAGYCRKRIGREAYEKAWEAYLQTKEDNAQTDEWQEEADAEIEARKDAEDKKDRETEENFNGKKKTKKAAKPRRSKDIAHESNGVTLTTKQVEFLKALPKCSFWEDGLDSGLWCDCIADDIGWNPMSVGAMVSTLREKDLVVVIPQKVNNKKCKSMEFTELGKKVAKELGLA